MNFEDSKFQDFVSSSTSRFQLWKALLGATNAKAMVEIGVWRGNFAKQILEQCQFIERYYMIDPWAMLPDWNKPMNFDSQVFNDVYAEAMGKIEFASEKVVVLRGKTKEVIDQIPDGSLDFAYIDGDHTLRGITIDLIKLFPKMKANSLIGGDDFIECPWQHGIQFEPTLVCPFSIYFAEAMDLPIVALPFNQFLIQKKTDTSFSFIDYTGKHSDLSLNISGNIIKSKAKAILKLLANKITASV